MWASAAAATDEDGVTFTSRAMPAKQAVDDEAVSVCVCVWVGGGRGRK